MSVTSLYTGMAGLQALNAQMEAVAANLANQQTTGYAAVQAATEAAAYQGANAPAGADPVALTTGPNPAQGSLTHTGDPLDVALGGDAWLLVQTGTGNALTRDGSLQISNAGLLTDASGNPVLNAGGQPISLPPLANLQIGADGTVSGVPAATPGGAAQNFGQIDLVATPGTLTPLSGTLYSPGSATLGPASNASLHQGYLNASNVDPTQAMMSLITDSRSYQLQTNLMKTQSGANQALNAVLSQA
jgi:flagellar basal-body rod protein FlgF